MNRPAPSQDLNLAVLRGVVTAAPQSRDLPSGSVVVQFDVATRSGRPGAGPPSPSSSPAAASASSPVAWIDPSPRGLEAVCEGIEVVVIGSVRRRFFRVGGATQSRTEIVAEVVLPARRRAQVAAAIGAVVERLTTPAA